MGLAAGQTVTRTANPIGTVCAKGGVPNWVELDRAVADWSPNRLIVGLPLNMDGSESEMSGRARNFAKRLQKRYALDVELADERLTTREAKRLQPDADDHALAARLIAETWLSH